MLSKNTMYRKKQLDILKNRMLEPRHFIQIVTGPRQVGKTTLIKQLIEELSLPITYFSADNVSHPDSNWIDLQWDIQRTKFQTSNSKECILVFDEIQKISNWSEAIKKQWDKDSFESRNIKLILLGSSQMLLQKGISESLAGRFELIPFTQWSYTEMNKAFGFTELEYLWFGGYPGGAVLKNNEERWKEYILFSLIEPTLYKDILLTTKIDKPALLRNLFELGCSYSGQIVTFQKILGQLDDAGNTTTISHYLSLLDVGGLLSGIEKYSKEKIRQRASSPKWQVRDNALLSVMSGKTFEQTINNPVIFGRFVESVVGAHLLNSKKENKINLYYWREADKEVDYIMEYNNKIISIEVKSSVSKSSKGLYEFKKRYNPHKSLIIEKNGLQWNDLIKIDPRELF